MKLKTVSVAVAAAICSVGALHAANNQVVNPNTVQAVNATFADIKKLTEEFQDVSSSTMLQNDGLNVQLNSQGNKFQEEGLDGEHVYIVKLNDNSVALEAQNLASPLARTMRSQGVNKLFEQGQATISAVVDYQNQLLTKQQTVMHSVTAATGRTEIRHQFTKALNGFSVKMTEAEASRVSALGGVSSVMRSKKYDLLSDEGPTHIGADKIWDGTSVPSGIQGKGEGQIVGIIDTGINSDHPSFAAVGGDGYEHTNPFGAGNYVGDCVEEPDEVQCNNKLIGVRSYDVVTDSYSAMIPGWPAIGEDYQGHGSHVASTAAGNVLYDVPYMVAGYGEESDGKVLKEALFPQLSGVAPHANVISYQVCYPSSEEYSGCPGEALVAGIEDAISDGVDVLNFSIGGADSNVWADPVQLAFLAAREAGISVAAAAGNNGQACGDECFGYLDNSSPWLAQVAATTHGRTIAVDTMVEFAGFIDPALGAEVPAWSDTGLVGGSINTDEITGVVVWAKDYEDINGEKDSNGYCATEYPEGAFDFFKDGTAIPGAADGSSNVFVVCQRHDPADPTANARTAKVSNVKAGGADGFIMFNKLADQGTVAESYELPSVHFTYDQWHGVYPDQGLEDWIDHNSELGHQITIKPTVIERRVKPEDADWLADFSSRGPSYQNEEILAPAISAPGVNIYAAYSDEHPFLPTPNGQDYIAISGTSMASPHIAGSMALLRQIHPEWTPAQIQSALLMTADNVVQYRRLNNATGDIEKAETYRAGTGRVNVASAAKAGFVMDESADNFLAADPYNGGTPHKLNLPNLVNFSCKPECQWIRTITATEDGTWSVSQGDVVNWNFDSRQQSAQNGVNIEVEPSTFSLKKGESQTIIVKASIMDTQDWFSNAEVELHSRLTFKAEQADIPDAQWPVVFKYDRGDLPSSVKTTAHADQGSFVVNNVNLPNVAAPVAQAYKPVKATVETFVIPKDSDQVFPWAMNRTDEVNPDDILDEAIATKFVTVPANAKRFTVEVVDIESPFEGTHNRGNPNVYIGKDYNGDGIIQPQDEILCVSSHVLYKNFCNINNPESGEYWAVIYNSKDPGQEGVEETFDVAFAVVTDQYADEIDVTLPGSDGVETVDMTINWDMAMEPDAIYYSMIDVGTSAVNVGNIGSVPLKIERGVDAINLDVPNSTAKVGDRIPFTFEVLANNSGQDRDFSFELDIPEGLSVRPSDVLVGSASEVSTEVVDGKVIISGVQQDTSDLSADYIITDNITDEMCKLPDLGNSNPGGYINLSEFGINPSLSGFDDTGMIQYSRGWVVPLNTLFGGYYDAFSLYNNTEDSNVPGSLIQIKGNGMVDFSGAPIRGTGHSRLPFNTFPNEVLAPLWRAEYNSKDTGLKVKDMMSVGLSASEGISMASTASGWAIVEWDNAADYGDIAQDPQTRQITYTKRDNSFDFQVLFNANTRFGKNEHEIYFAYDNIDFGSTQGQGSIGIQGFKGMWDLWGPLNGHKGDSQAYDNLDEVVKDDYIICMDYVGPESSQFEVTAWAEVLPSASGQNLEITATTSMSGMADISVTKTLSVPGNITIVPLNDMTTTEETAVSFDVDHIDEMNSKNEISVISADVTYEVDGETVTITPVADFFGETEIEVVVSDIENPTDKASTTFMLTVTGVSDAPVVEVATTDVVITEGEVVTLDASSSSDADGDEITFAWSGAGVIADATAAMTTVSGLEPGQHSFTVTVSDGEHESTSTVNVEVVTISERLAISSLDDMVIDEGGVAELVVNFTDELGKETVITAVADNAEIEVMGHESGSTLKVTPNAGVTGDVNVTVMVAYTDTPTTVSKETFTLTVNEVEDTTVVEETKSNSSSGSLAWLTVLMAGFASLRRRRVTK
ncbi:S8 family serine peptidase [Pseudoalteromonas shioyasakiensis]|uniref:S8 family serine peptidase n=1 Tax=Pseudoalteromonas shioyasakiensis TaxID=1190813 RepID=UPI0027406B5B|nr:S8 family serine peptidase [Pseudoalteromonas shioyasakiensis]